MMPDTVLTCAEISLMPLATLLSRYQLTLVAVENQLPIPGSFWGDVEAGLIGNKIFFCSQTPIHSILHEACHYICMDNARRMTLHTDAGGDYLEENGVCYLQIILAAQLPQVGQARLFADMDSWGYSFRLGSSRAWFEHDAEDARQWLSQHHLIDEQNQPTWQLRQ
ncbi:MAG: hypothetical protein SVR94_06560 [Pseudomonadota bacterium]|nr:hypothetical protein [Pseudomonadota bacterium]